MRKILLLLFLFISISAIAQTKDMLQVDTDANPHNILVVDDVSVYKGTVESIDQIANIPEKDIVEVETKRISYAGVDNVVVNIKTKIN